MSTSYVPSTKNVGNVVLQNHTQFFLITNPKQSDPSSRLSKIPILFEEFVQEKGWPSLCYTEMDKLWRKETHIKSHLDVFPEFKDV